MLLEDWNVKRKAFAFKILCITDKLLPLLLCFCSFINIAHLFAGSPIQFLNFAESAWNINAVSSAGIYGADYSWLLCFLCIFFFGSTFKLLLLHRENKSCPTKCTVCITNQWRRNMMIQVWNCKHAFEIVSLVCFNTVKSEMPGWYNLWIIHRCCHLLLCVCVCTDIKARPSDLCILFFLLTSTQCACACAQVF